jgi:sugar phosphate isomerase/epimerase
MRGSAAALGAAALGSQLLPAAPAHAQEDRPMVENGLLGFGTVTYNIAKDMDLDTLLEVSQRVGLDAVELRSTHAHGVEPSLTEAERTDVRAKFEDSPVVLAGLGSTCEYHSPDPTEVEANIEETKRFIELAKDVGAMGVKVRPNGLPDDVPVDKTLEQIGEALNVVGPVAADAGVEIFVEVHGHGTADPKNMARIMEVCQHPAVGVTWNCNGTDLVDGSIRETFPLLRDRVKMVHMHELASDYPFEEELFPFLLDMGFDRYCLAEAAGLGDPERFLRYYKALFDALVRLAAEARG